LKFFFTRNRVFKHKEDVSNLHVCCNGVGKNVTFIHKSLFTRILKSTLMKKFNIFCIIYVEMSNIHFSALDNVKMTCQTHKY